MEEQAKKIDAYYRDRGSLPLAERARINYDHPDSLETDLLVEHLKILRACRVIDVPVYDFAQHIRKAETRRVEPRSIILVEGILIFGDRALRETAAPSSTRRSRPSRWWPAPGSSSPPPSEATGSSPGPS